MIAFLGFMAAVTLVLWLAPESAAGRALHRQLVARPLEALGRLERHHLILVVIMSGFMLSGGEMLMLAGPELVGAFALDLAIYLDAVLVTYAVSALSAARRSGGWLKFALTRMVQAARPRAKRSARPVGPKRKPSNDDDPGPAILRAA